MSFTRSNLLKIPHVSPLELEDEHLFRVAFPKDSVRYSRSWLYVLRAAHLLGGELGFKFVSPDLVAVIGYRNEYVYVTAFFDNTAGIRLRELCDEITRATSCRIIIKKMERYESDRDVPTSDDLPLEDDYSYETSLQLQRLFVTPEGALNPAARRVIRKVRAFKERAQDLVIVEDIKQVPLERVEQFLRRHKEKYENYIPMVRYLMAQTINEYSYRPMIFLLDGEIRGVYITEKLSLNELGFYCGVTSKDEPGLTEWMDIHFFRKMFIEGIQTVYLGGAERDGIAQFIDKLLPYRPSYSVQAVLYRPTPSPIFDISLRLAEEADFNALAEIYRDTYNAMDILEERWTKEAAHKFISHFYRRQSDLFFVAEHDGIVIGAVVAGVQPWWDGNHLVEGELFINRRYEKTEIVKRLLKKLLIHARDKYKAVAWDTIMPNNDTHPLASYKQIGFSEVPHWKALSGDTYTLLNRLEA